MQARTPVSESERADSEATASAGDAEENGDDRWSATCATCGEEGDLLCCEVWNRFCSMYVALCVQYSHAMDDSWQSIGASMLRASCRTLSNQVMGCLRQHSFRLDQVQLLSGASPASCHSMMAPFCVLSSVLTCCQESPVMWASPLGDKRILT